MTNIKFNSILGVVILFWFTIQIGLKNNTSYTTDTIPFTIDRSWYKDHHDTIKVHRDINVRDYFQFIDSLIYHYDSLTSYTLSEHLLVRTNPWIIDSLKQTDYYLRIAKDSFVYDQSLMIVLPRASKILLPDSIKVQELLKTFSVTTIDINIPEYKLRILKDSVVCYEFPIRVGRNEKKFLEMSGRMEDLRTRTGKGTIVGHNRYPRYVNPVDNQEYEVTRRDDGKLTKLPQIPFIETELNGLRHGQLIHSTTNPETLGKAYSNGCIGTSEADAWIIYYHAPLGTNINIRYDLNIANGEGDSIRLKDIYKINQ